MFQALVDFLGPEALKAAAMTWAPRVLAALAALLLLAVALRGVNTLLAAFLKRADVDPTAQAFILSVVRVFVGAVGLLTALDQLGVDTTGILASLGVVGLTLGFAAQNTLANVISGLFIFWDRPFVLHDLVEVDGEYGRVEQITLRSTRLVTVDGRMLAIPNSIIADSKVASYTNFPTLRIDVPVTVGVNEDLGRVREALLSIVAGDERYVAEKPAVVVVKTLGDYFVEVELRVWLKDEKEHIAERFRLRELVKTTLDDRGVEMPFETLSVTPLTVKQAAAAS